MKRIKAVADLDKRIGKVMWHEGRDWVSVPDRKLIGGENRLSLKWMPIDSFCKYCNKKIESDKDWKLFPILWAICDDCDSRDIHQSVWDSYKDALKRRVR